MSVEISPIGRQLLRDEREPRVKRITARTNETARCFESGLYDAAVVMQFIELDTWAYLMRPATMTKHGRDGTRFVRRSSSGAA